MNPILIIKTGCTIESLLWLGDFEDWICAGMNIDRAGATVINVFEDEALPNPTRYSAIVITGSPAMVSDRERWSENTAVWLREAVDAEIPTLGICYGHQLIAHALGGTVGPNPRGREIGTTEMTLHETAADDPLLAPFGASLRIHMSHSESVLQLPNGATRLASTAQDPNSAFSIGTAWGIQFHPEFDAQIMHGYLTARRPELTTEDIDTAERLSAVTECPDGPAVLHQFAQLRRQGN